ncbi:MAG: DUF1638 domain-containing protein [archaeon]|nr:DUF1638 domain-containing protein [archaeon]
MAKGILLAIVCPMLEDELVYGFTNDPEEKKIYLLENQYSGSFYKKLKNKGIDFEYVPQVAFEGGRIDIDRGKYNIVILMNSLGLHSEPAELREFVDSQIARYSELVDSIGLYYGLCGNYGWDVTKIAEEKGYKPVSVFRDTTGRVCDDCIGVSVNGGENYLNLQKKYTGMLFVTPAVAINWDDFMGAGDFAKQMSNFDEETLEAFGIHDQDSYLRWMFEMCHYEYTVKITTGLVDDALFEPMFQRIAEKMALKPLVIEDGWVSLEPAKRIYESSKRPLCI